MKKDGEKEKPPVVAVETIELFKPVVPGEVVDEPVGTQTTAGEKDEHKEKEVRQAGDFQKSQSEGGRQHN